MANSLGRAGVVGVWLWLALWTPGPVRGAEAVKPRDQAATDAGWSDLTPLVIHTPFGNVRYPHLDARGNVLFIADDSRASKGEHHGIYRYGTDGALVCLVRGGETTVPSGMATLHTIHGLQVDEDASDFVFNAYDTENRRGLYHWSKGKLDTVARTGDTVLPGATQPLDEVGYGSLQGGRVLYKGGCAGLGAVLVLHDLASDQDRVLCHGKMAIPGHASEVFQSISSTNSLGGDSVVFGAASVADPDDKDAKNTSGLYGWFGVKDWSEASKDLLPERLRTVVDGTMPVPIANLPGETTFGTLGSAPCNGNQAVFWALGQGFSGIFAARMPDGSVRCLVNNHTQIDGQFKGTFTSFGHYPALLGPNLVFTAEASSDTDNVDDTGDVRAPAAKKYRGVFVYRLDRGELFTLTDNRAPLEGKEIASYEIGGHVLAGDRFAVTVIFKDKSSRIFLGTIQPAAFKQLTDGTPSKKPDPTR